MSGSRAITRATRISQYQHRHDRERGTLDGYYNHYRRGDINYGEIQLPQSRIAGAVVAVPAAAFVGARSVHTSAIALFRETFTNARDVVRAVTPSTRAWFLHDRPSQCRAASCSIAASLRQARHRRLFAADAPMVSHGLCGISHFFMAGQGQAGARDVKINERNNITGRDGQRRAGSHGSRTAGGGAASNVSNTCRTTTPVCERCAEQRVSRPRTIAAPAMPWMQSRRRQCAANSLWQAGRERGAGRGIYRQTALRMNNSSTGQGRRNAQNGNGRVPACGQ
jgi:hypothetical protein